MTDGADAGAGALPATADNFEANMAAVDMDAPAGGTEAAPEASDGANPQDSVGSMFGETAAPVDGVDPVTGRQMDGMDGLPGEDQEAGDEQPEMEADAEGDGDAPEVELTEEQQADAAVSEALKSLELDGEVPADLMSRLTMKQTINGEEVSVSLADAAKNGMRMVDYSRGKRELSASKKEHQGQIDNLIDMTARWKGEQPDARSTTRRDLVRMGIPIDAIAQDIAEEYVSLQNMSEHERSSYERAKASEHEVWKANERVRQLEHEQQQAKSQQDTGGKRAEVNGWAAKAFKASGLQASATTKKMFSSHLDALWDRSVPLTEQTVKDAVEAANDEWRDAVGVHQANQATKTEAAGRKKRRGIPAKPAAGGGGKAGQGRKGNKRATLANFDEYIAGKG